MPLSELEGLAIRTLRGNRRGEVRFDDRGNPQPYREPTEEERQNRLRTLALQEQARAATSQSSAAGRQAESQYLHEQTARELGGLTPLPLAGGVLPTTLIPSAPGGAALPRDVQDQAFQQELGRINDTGIPAGRLLMDYSQKGYLDQPGGAALLQYLRSQRAQEVGDIARGDNLFGFWDKVFLSPRDMAGRRAAVDQGVQAAVAGGGGLPAPTRNIFGSETPTSENVRLQVLLRRVYPELFQR
jgi:hypothetical protein